MTSVALVLGAGGVAGGAYEAGVLAAIAEASGWDAREADLIVGTSAGAGLAATLRLGLSPADHLARATGEPLSDEGRALLGEDTEPLALPDRSMLPVLGVPMAPWLIAPALLMPGPMRPLLAVAGWCPRGSHDPSVMGERIRAISRRVETQTWPERPRAGDGPERPRAGDWPEQPTWICATRECDGRRVVFGRDDVATPDLGTAVEASSAVPAFFRPVGVEGTTYIDGGVFSPSNLDLVAGLGFDLVVVVSPMSTVPPDPFWSPRRLSRSLQAGLLRGEVDKVAETGTAILDLSPTPDEAAGFGLDLLSADRRETIARRARESARRNLATPAVAELVGMLQAAAEGDTEVRPPGPRRSP